MGEEMTNGVSEVLKELYGVLELMTVYMLCLGVLGGVGCHCDGVGRVDMEGGGSTSCPANQMISNCHLGLCRSII